MFEFSPIATFHCNQLHKCESPRQGTLNPDQYGSITLPKGQNFEQAIIEIEGFERLWVIYVFNQSLNWKPMVQPPRLNKKKVGVFASRAPYRPNPIGLSCVKLERIEGLSIIVSEFDLLDNTPILDIKPYLPYCDSFSEAKVGWVSSEDPFELHFSQEASAQIEFLQQNGVDQLSSFLDINLKNFPIDQKRKRIEKKIDHWIISYRTWRVLYQVNDQQVYVLSITSGYSPSEMEENKDTYGDKHIHRSFSEYFS